MKLIDFQRWLNIHGANIVADGKPGPATRAAILSVFQNFNAPPVSDIDMLRIASRLGCTIKQLAAVGKVESAGGGWDNDGRLKCLFERHYVWRRIRVLIPFLSNPTPGGYTTDADRDGINDSWEKVADMAMRNPLVAFESASWGKFQIMGAHAAAMGYANAIEFTYALSRGEAAHYEALARFIEMAGLKPALRRLSTRWTDNTDFARGYNGKGQKGYDVRLAGAMA